MPRWVRTIQIKDLLTDGEDAETIKAAATGILSRVPASAPTGKFVKSRDMADEDPETALLVFNDGMNRLYDWADANRVWLA